MPFLRGIYGRRRLLTEYKKYTDNKIEIHSIQSGGDRSLLPIECQTYEIIDHKKSKE